VGRGTHSYAAPARKALQAQAFRDWLTRTLQTTRVRCYSRTGHTVPCSGT
jgi:hypothetical protein